jgi:hypothetical protein
MRRRLAHSVARVVESIEVARALLAAVPELPKEQRQILQTRGGEDRLAENALGDVVTAFETYCRARLKKQKGQPSCRPGLSRHGLNVFQRLQDAVAVMEAQLGSQLANALSKAEWRELRAAFATRHVLTHNLGIADVDYVASGGSTSLANGFRLRGTEADRALALVERLVRAM